MVAHLCSSQPVMVSLIQSVYLVQANSCNVQKKNECDTSVTWQPKTVTLIQSVFFYKPMPIPTFKQILVPHLCLWQPSLVYSDTVSILLQASANPNLQRNDGALMFACLNSYPQIVQLLLTNGADHNVQYSNGLTALMCACHTGCLESTELLLMSGADPSMVDSQGLTALDIAVFKGHDDIIDLIQAIDLSQSSTTSPVLTATEIATTIDNEAMAILNKAMEDMLAAKAELYISTYYKKFKRTLSSKSDQENIQTIV